VGDHDDCLSPDECRDGRGRGMRATNAIRRSMMNTSSLPAPAGGCR
jgi:hypothetical protein